MKKTGKKLLAALLALSLLCGALPLAVGAASGDHTVYVHAKDLELESVSDTFWSWERYEQTLTGGHDYRKVESTAYSWKTNVTVTIDHEEGYARLDFKRVIGTALPSDSEFSTKLKAYGAERGDNGAVWPRTNNQYVWGRTYKYSRAKDYLSKTPAQATLYAKLVSDGAGNSYLTDPIWDGEPYRCFKLDLESVAEQSLIGEPTGGLDPEKAAAYAANPASPPAMVFDKEVVVGDVLYEYIGQTVGCIAKDAGAVNGAQVVGKVNSDRQFTLATSLGGKEEKPVASALGEPMNEKGKATSVTHSGSGYDDVFPEKIRNQLDGGEAEGPVGLCKDVRYDKEGGSAIINSNGTISMYPAEGYEVGSITVNGNEISFTTDVSGWTIISGIRTTDKVVINFTKKAASSSAFTDVPANAYYKDAVDWAVEKHITSGVGNGKFDPKGNCNRGQIVTFLWHMAGDPTPTSSYNPFTDVKPGAFYYLPVLWAVENNITSGMTPTQFKPNSTCNRAQICTFLWNYLGYPVGTGRFSDVSANAYYANAVAWASTAGVTSGTGNGKFSPNKPCTRCEGVTFLYNARNIAPTGNNGGSTAVDNDKTGYQPVSWSWSRDGTEGYDQTYFTSGKYVRKDGKAVLYIESSSSPDFFSFQLYAMADGGKDAWKRPDQWNKEDYMTADRSGSKAESDMEFFSDNGSHTITLKTEYEDEMPLYYSMPDGEYVLVREK